VQSIQLYIEGQRVDMFKDESVSITQSIQNVKDIAKVFTEFTKTFTLPASKTNNKIFKHYYNFDITGGFDARTKKDATLELNYLPFKKGKIKLEGVDLKNRRPKSYRITFFGNTVTLKDLLGEDKLSALTDLNKYNQLFAFADLKRALKRNPSRNSTGTVDTIGTSSITDGSGFGTVSVGDLITNTSTNETTYITSYPISTAIALDEQIFTSAGQGYEIANHVLAPIITHSKRLYYDSGDNTHNTGNLYYGSGQKHGLAWNELKYALRVHKIIEAIEDRYGITFSTDFFNTSNDVYYDLYMWLHRKKGVVSGGTQVSSFTNLVNGWTAGTGTGNVTYLGEMLNSYTLKINSPFAQFFQLELQRTSTTAYDVSIAKDGVEVYSDTNITSTYKAINLNSYSQSGSTYTLTLTYAASITFTDIEWTLAYPPFSQNQFFNTGSYTAPANFEFVISEQIPEIKVIDFLTGLFKMFNLTTFVEDDGTIFVDTLDDFYLSGTNYDISEFVDVNSSQVNVALPYREISFSYEDTDTFLAATHNQLFGQEWAKTDYSQTDDDGNVVDGSLYGVVAPFGHPKYERLVDLDTSNNTDIQWGWSVDDNQESYIGKPLLFYPVYTNPFETISFVELVDADGNYNNHVPISGSVNMPSNSVSFSSGTSTANINFKLEKNEYTGDSSFTGTLFENYYSTYITNVFNTKNRLTKVKAYLPLRILLNFTLADRFDINGKRYKINSIETNLATGESNIELLNEL
jgi:hypothetical protein